MITRRHLLMVGATLFTVAPARLAWPEGPLEIVMNGRPDGSRTWFDPLGLLIRPGQTVRWINRDRSNSHSATAYHPTIADRPLRIPEGAEPWNSDLLLPGESFTMTFSVPGVYDYYCIPHEQSGMVGRILVTSGDDALAEPRETGDISEAALRAFPSIKEIRARGTIHPAEGRDAATSGALHAKGRRHD